MFIIQYTYGFFVIVFFVVLYVNSGSALHSAGFISLKTKQKKLMKVVRPKVLSNFLCLFYHPYIEIGLHVNHS